MNRLLFSSTDGVQVLLNEGEPVLPCVIDPPGFKIPPMLFLISVTRELSCRVAPRSPLALLCTAVDLPPPPDEVLGDILRGVRAGGEDHRVHLAKVAVLPWLHWTNEVYDLCVSAKPLESRCIAVGHVGHHIVNEWQVVLDVFCGPVTPVEIQKTLVSTIKAAALSRQVHEIPEGFHGGLKDKYTCVETIGPADVRGSGQLLSIKQFIHILQHQCVCVQEDTLGVLCQSPGMDLRESDAKLWSC